MVAKILWVVKNVELGKTVSKPLISKVAAEAWALKAGELHGSDVFRVVRVSDGAQLFVEEGN